ncbi:unnamed protein product [Parnassius apollo]|uniref:(apollo) hypothetical protein n=1 Tax=Parnassius apollo TaxID=110799 RepID=A0A8S3Y5X5_PARAO|nr:unnamed protein product [Parnassius apollo]
MELTPATMEKLVELLKEPEPDVLQGEDVTFSGYEITSNRDKETSVTTNIAKAPRTIEEYEEQEAIEIEKLGGVGSGDRKTPEYSMNYQQSVSAEDVFLQIGPKTPSSASCENLIVKIKMLGDKKENIELSVDTKKCYSKLITVFFISTPSS